MGTDKEQDTDMDTGTNYRHYYKETVLGIKMAAATRLLQRMNGRSKDGQSSHDQSGDDQKLDVSLCSRRNDELSE